MEALRRAARVHLFSWWPSPSLDGNPVLWREWHRNRPSRMGRLVTTLYVAATSIAMAVGVADAMRRGMVAGNDLVGFNMLAVWSGLLLLSVTTPTSLTEERSRASLDILMSTPLPTHSIVMGKWWASCRRMLPLLILPALTGLFVGFATPDIPVFLPPAFRNQATPISTTDRVMSGILPTVFLAAHAAAVTSLGLALATWLKRTGLAVAISVGAFVLASIGWIVAVVTVIRPLLDWWSRHVAILQGSTILTIEQAAIALSPLGGQSTASDLLMNVWNLDRSAVWKLLLLDAAFVILVAAVLLSLTLMTFNWCMGRMNETPGLRRFVRFSTRSRQAPLRPAPLASDKIPEDSLSTGFRSSVGE